MLFTLVLLWLWWNLSNRFSIPYFSSVSCKTRSSFSSCCFFISCNWNNWSWWIFPSWLRAPFSSCSYKKDQLKVLKGSTKTSMLWAKSVTCSAQLPEYLTVRNSQKQNKRWQRLRVFALPLSSNRNRQRTIDNYVKAQLTWNRNIWRANLRIFQKHKEVQPLREIKSHSFWHRLIGCKFYILTWEIGKFGKIFKKYHQQLLDR